MIRSIIKGLKYLSSSSFSLILLLSSSLSLISCSSFEEEDGYPQKATANVTFVPTTQSITPLTRADANSTGTPTCLMVIDYVDGEFKAAYTRGYDENDFDEENALSALSLPLTYGQHTLYFVSSAAKWDSHNTSNHTITWADQVVTWAKKVDINVNKVNMPSQDVNMEVCMSFVSFYINDALPADLAKITLSLQKRTLTYDYVAGKGAEGTSYERTFDISSSYIGKTKASFSAFTFVPSNAEETTYEDLSANNIGDMTLSAFDADDNELGTKTVTDVCIIAGYKTIVSGKFFSDFNQPYSMTVESSYKGTINLSY